MSASVQLSAAAVSRFTPFPAGLDDAGEAPLQSLLPLVYDELRRLASSYMRRERPGHTLQATALVHEAYLRLANQRVFWRNRSHFFGVAAQIMRRILVDHAKSHATEKRGRNPVMLSLDAPLAISSEAHQDIVTVDEALRAFERIDPARARVVELRFFGGLSNDEAAEVLGVSPATVQRQWSAARAWLFHEIGRGSAG
jgi:RNA polymerase sigma-70 factor (ECF subfamily)